MKKTERRVDSQMTGGRRSGRTAGGQIESKNWEDRQGMRMGSWKTGWQKNFLQTLSLSQQGLQELSELQVDPILGIQHNFYFWNRNLGRIWCHLKAEQGQGHSHLQLIHGKVLPNAVPGSGKENDMRNGLKPSVDLSRHRPLSPCQEWHIHGPLFCGSTQSNQKVFVPFRSQTPLLESLLLTCPLDL